MTDWKELGDQAAHFAIGAGVAFGLGFLSPLLGVPVVGAAAWAREYLQSSDPKDLWDPASWCGGGCSLDMAFWLLGAGAGTVAYLTF